MKIKILSILVLLILSCSSLKQNGGELLKNNKNIEIAKILILKDNDSLYFNELRLHLSSALHTKKYMFKKFGQWDEAIKINEFKNYLIWKKCRLFEDKEEFYTVTASGVENRKEMYSSIVIQNKDNNDLFSENSKLKDTLISMFYYGTKKTNLSSDKFYNEYLKMRKSIE
ncbi:hypothetical protein H9W90_03520 [Polaribacter pectinis]|uniref:Lipoprotein n=1 Tax=Polaribacter pectinis TaxID=2738844 RepID=A0A7G9LC53_9FLAO|nr:hypothetical protein [Polaribacter pectinis]QNM86202.1 hypothetical protein H9W90_03520 [Polaribacter pectinis]